MLEKLLKDVQTVAVICNQWGDSGKGKFSDYFAKHWADVIARGTGGNNAGHTVVIDGKERIFHLLPAGIAYDGEGKVNILGNGLVIDLKVLNHELDELDQDGGSYKNLMISKDANVIMPYQIARDKAKNQSQKSGGIGSTGRGIGPCYSDKIARRGVLISDLYDKNKFMKKVIKASSFYPEQKIDESEVWSELRLYADRIKDFVRDTVTEMHNFYRQGKKIAGEGAQGLILSIEHGTYPYVTSSDCSLNGTATGFGLSAKMIDLPLGIIKYPFKTRVGGGPFPTEIGGADAEEYCQNESHVKIQELKVHGIPYIMEDGKPKYDSSCKEILEMVNSEDSLTQNIGIRLAAAEYGATTGRPRRIGWTDALIAKYAVGINGPFFILTKPDCLAGIKEFNLCYGYKNGEKTDKDFNKDSDYLRSVTPELKSYEGYSDISDVKEYDGLPSSLRQSIVDFEKFTGGEVKIVSTGAEQSQTKIR